MQQFGASAFYTDGSVVT